MLAFRKNFADQVEVLVFFVRGVVGWRLRTGGGGGVISFGSV
jgi:hypothetical protein